VDSPPPEVAGDITALWRRNSDPRTIDPVVDPAMNVVVSMTTHGKRLRDVWLAIESIGRGTVKPARVILWLDSEPKRLPPRLRRLVSRGLEVRWTRPGLGVHTKYLPYLRTMPLRLPLVLADDDILYPENWLEGLVEAHRSAPGDVVAYRAHVIGMTDDGSFAAYQRWQPCENTEPSFANFATSVSGQLLPVPLQRALRDEDDAFLDLAPTADDIWLHRVGVQIGIRTRQVGDEPRHWWFLPGSQVSGLNAVNVWDGGNDRQMAVAHTDLTRSRIRGDLRR
jgi:hypothetical protein